MPRLKYAKFGNGYEAELDLEAGAENGTELGIKHATSCDITRGRFRASLAALEATGELESSSGAVHKVPPGIIGDIANWAYREGHMG